MPAQEYGRTLASLQRIIERYDTVRIHAFTPLSTPDLGNYYYAISLIYQQQIAIAIVLAMTDPPTGHARSKR